MGDDRMPADAARAMQTMIRDPQQQRAARGRFGRDVPGLVPADAQTPDARMQNQMGEQIVYVVDPDAVAAAIVDRLMAGGTLRARAEDA
jgi:hypothetical protein